MNHRIKWITVNHCGYGTSASKLSHSSFRSRTCCIQRSAASSSPSWDDEKQGMTCKALAFPSHDLYPNCKMIYPIIKCIEHAWVYTILIHFIPGWLVLWPITDDFAAWIRHDFVSRPVQLPRPKLQRTRLRGRDLLATSPGWHLGPMAPWQPMSTWHFFFVFEERSETG